MNAYDIEIVNDAAHAGEANHGWCLSLIHISEPTRQAEISYAVFCLKKKKQKTQIKKKKPKREKKKSAQKTTKHN